MKIHFVLALMCSVTLLSCYKTQLSPDDAVNDPHGKNATGQLALAGVTYYVATTGDDANDGSLGAPFRTINKALTVVAPGDVVQVRGGTYVEKVRFPVSGAKGNPITLTAYPGETPVISGQGLSVSGTEGLITLDSAQYININGLEITGLSVTSDTPVGILIIHGGDYIHLTNNHLHHIDNAGGSSYAILVDNPTDDDAIWMVIDGNTIHDCATGTGANLALNGYITSFTISNNTVYNGVGAGISTTGDFITGTTTFQQLTHGTISGNTVYNLHGTDASGIFVSNGVDIIMERNRVSDTDLGIWLTGVASPRLSIQCYIRNNFVYNCSRSGICLGTPNAPANSGSNTTYVANNTLFFNGAAGNDAELVIWNNAKANFVRNNIIYARPAGIFWDFYSGSTVSNLATNNAYYTTGTQQWRMNGGISNTLANWRLASNTFEVSSTEGINPLLVSTAAGAEDLHLQASSPAKNTGAVGTYTGTLDIDGQRRTVNATDKGADELQ